MTAPDGHLDVLDPRFPIRLSQPESIFWEMRKWTPDRHCMDGLVMRARDQAARHQERYVTPRWVPERAHEDTSVDGIPPVLEHDDAWYGDRFAGHRPEDIARWRSQLDAVTERTGHLDVILPETQDIPSLAAEISAAPPWRMRARRAVMRLVRGT